MMHYRAFLMLVFLVLASCKTTKSVSTVNEDVAKNLSVRKVLKNHKATNFSKKTIDARLRVQYSDNRGPQRQRYTFNVQLRMQKNAVIWLRGTKLVTVFKAKITPDSFSYYSPLDKTYFTGDFSMLSELLGFEINYYQLQNVLLGQSFSELDPKGFNVNIENNAYVLSPQKKEALFSFLFSINAKHFKLDNQKIRSSKSSESLAISYQGYISKDKELFPKKTIINATEGEKYTFIALDVKSIQFNTNLAIPYAIPSGYSPIRVK